MSKKIKIISAGVACAVAAYFGTTYYMGNKLNSEMPALVERANESLQKTNMPLSLNISHVEKGFFSTKAVLTVLSNNDELMSFDVVAQHGPLPGFSSLGLASFTGTLKDDKNIQAAYQISQTPITLGLSGQVSLAGDASLAVDMAALSNSIYGTDIATDKLVLGLEAKANSDIAWSLSTDKLTIAQGQGEQQNLLTIDGLKLSGHNLNMAANKTSQQVKYQLQIGSTTIKNALEPRMSGQFKNVDVVFALNSQEDFTDVSYALSLSDFKIGALVLNAVDTKLNLKQIPTSELQGNVQLATFTLPLSLRQSIMMNDEAILAAKPSMELETFNVINASGQFLGNAKLVYGQSIVSADNINEGVDFASLPLKEANIDFKAERAFLNQLISEFMQVNTGIDKATADTQAPLVIEEMLIASQRNGGFLQASDKELIFNFTLKDDKATLNHTPLTKEKMQGMFKMLSSML